MHLNKPIEVVLRALSESTGKPPIQSGDGWKTCCPAHDDKNPSLSVSEGDDGKEIRPIHRNDAGWSIGAMPELRPLYRLRDIVDAEVVFVCEGEKAVDAAVSIELKATTSSGGSNATKQTDWSPLAGKRFVSIPDNDPPGRKFAETVAEILVSLGCEVRIIDLKDDFAELPEKGDLDDWLEAHDAVEPEVLRERIKALAWSRTLIELCESGATFADIREHLAASPTLPVERQEGAL